MQLPVEIPDRSVCMWPYSFQNSDVRVSAPSLLGNASDYEVADITKEESKGNPRLAKPTAVAIG